MKARSGIPVGMVPIRDENGDVRLISFEEYRQWLRTDPSEKGQHPINNPEWTVTEDLWLDEEEQRILEYIKRTIPAEEVEHCLQFSQGKHKWSLSHARP